MDEHWDDVKKKSEVRISLTQGDDSTSYDITAPEWQKKPDDYGDPRVWIEVDEITTDKEFFFVKGHSNLMEGSYLTGRYSNTSKKVQRE